MAGWVCTTISTTKIQAPIARGWFILPAFYVHGLVDALLSLS